MVKGAAQWMWTCENNHIIKIITFHQQLMDFSLKLNSRRITVALMSVMAGVGRFDGWWKLQKLWNATMKFNSPRVVNDDECRVCSVCGEGAGTTIIKNSRNEKNTFLAMKARTATRAGGWNFVVEILEFKLARVFSAVHKDRIPLQSSSSFLFRIITTHIWRCTFNFRSDRIHIHTQYPPLYILYTVGKEQTWNMWNFITQIFAIC